MDNGKSVNYTNWNAIFEKLPVLIKGTGTLVMMILKIPNIVWAIPGLSKLKGIRMVLFTVLGSIHAVLLTFDINLLSNAICGIADLFNWSCNPEVFIGWFNKIMMWIIAALAIEDNQKK